MTMKHFNAFIFLFIVACMCLGGAGELSAQIPSIKRQTKPVKKKVAMAQLAPSDIALSVNDETMTWGEVLALLPEETKAKLTDDRDRAALTIRNYLRQVVRRGCLKQEALRHGYTLTKEERAKYVADLKMSLESRGTGQSVDDYLRQFIQEQGDVWYKMNVNDLMMVAKLNEEVTKDVVVTPEDIAQEREELKKRDEMSERKNSDLRQLFDKLTNDARIETDKWFKEVAKEYSDGTEAKNGGIISDYFSRAELAQALNMPSFDLIKGENTDVLENDDAIHIIRVFDVLPPDHEGGLERLKIGQIVFKKEELLAGVSDEIISNAVLMNKRNIAFNQYADKLVKDAKISCPLFPDGLFGK